MYRINHWNSLHSLLEEHWLIFQISSAFSQYLEALAIIPQLHLISKAGRTEKVVSCYIFGLTVYRSLYVMNWAYRYHNGDLYDLIFIVPATFEILTYCDYFFVLLGLWLISKRQRTVHRVINVNYPKFVLDYAAVAGSPQKTSPVTKI